MIENHGGLGGGSLELTCDSGPCRSYDSRSFSHPAVILVEYLQWWKSQPGESSAGPEEVLSLQSSFLITLTDE